MMAHPASPKVALPVPGTTVLWYPVGRRAMVNA